MKRNQYSFEVKLTFDKPVTDHTFLLRCLPAYSDTQTNFGHIRRDPYRTKDGDAGPAAETAGAAVNPL